MATSPWVEIAAWLVTLTSSALAAGTRVVGTEFGEPPFSRLSGGASVVLALPPVLAATTAAPSSPLVVMLLPASRFKVTSPPLPLRWPVLSSLSAYQDNPPALAAKMPSDPDPAT